MKKIKHFRAPTLGHFNTFFVPAVGHLPVYLKKILIPGGSAQRGGGWALLELSDALHSELWNLWDVFLRSKH